MTSRPTPGSPTIGISTYVTVTLPDSVLTVSPSVKHPGHVEVWVNGAYAFTLPRVAIHSFADLLLAVSNLGS